MLLNWGIMFSNFSLSTCRSIARIAHISCFSSGHTDEDAHTVQELVSVHASTGFQTVGP